MIQGESMDGRGIQVFGREDYHYMVVSASPCGARAHAEVWYSPACSMSRFEIAAELVRLAEMIRVAP